MTAPSRVAETAIRRPVYFQSAGETLAGEVMLPPGAGPHPALLICSGTNGDTRDGHSEAALRGEAPKTGKLSIIAAHLAAHGIASLRWDRRGVGESTGPSREWHSDLFTDVTDIRAALSALRATEEVDAARVALIGHSAGGHHLCLLAREVGDDEQPAAYVMHSALYASIEDLLRANGERLLAYAARGPEEEAWVTQVARPSYQMARDWPQWIAAAERGEDAYEGPDGYRRSLRRLKQEIEFAPADQFRYIQRPTLVIQGDQDLNVSSEDSHLITAAIRAAGNTRVTHVVVPNADHGMNITPEDADERQRQRIALQSYRNPISEFFLCALAGWLNDTLSPRPTAHRD